MAVVCRQYGHGAFVDVGSWQERRGAQRKRYDFIGGGLWRFYARVVHTIDGDIVYVLSIDDDVVLSRTSAVMAVACRQYGHGALVDVCSRRERRETFVVRCGIFCGDVIVSYVVWTLFV